MPGKVGFLNWGSGAGAIAGGIAGYGLAIPVAHALAASLSYTLFFGTATTTFLTSGALATIGMVGLGLTFGGVVLGAIIGGLVIKAITSRSNNTEAPFVNAVSHNISPTIDANTPEIEIDNGLPKKLWTESIYKQGAGMKLQER